MLIIGIITLDVSFTDFNSFVYTLNPVIVLSQPNVWGQQPPTTCWASTLINRPHIAQGHKIPCNAHRCHTTQCIWGQQPPCHPLSINNNKQASHTESLNHVCRHVFIAPLPFLVHAFFIFCPVIVPLNCITLG